MKVFLPVIVYTTSTGGGCKVISSRPYLLVIVFSGYYQFLYCKTIVWLNHTSDSGVPL